MTEDPRPLDVARIAFVTRRFHELRGLPRVLFGCGLVLAVVLTRAFDWSGGGPLQFVMLALLLGQSFVGPLDLWYRRTFGEIVVTPTAEFVAAWPVIGMMLGIYGDFFVQPTGRPIPSIAAAVLAAYALSVLARDGRRRLYYVLALLAGVAGMLVTASAPAGPVKTLVALPPARAHAFLLAYTWVGLSQAITGLLDHRLLAGTLRPWPSPTGSGTGRLMLAASNGRFRAVVAAIVFVGSVVSLGLGSAFGAMMMVAVPGFAFLVAAIMNSAFRVRRLALSQRMDLQEMRRARFEQQAALIGQGSHAIWIGVAAAGATDSWMLPAGRFVLLPFVIAAWSGWIAVRDWPSRGHYLIGAVAVAAAALAGVALPSAESFVLVVAAISGSIFVEGLLDDRLFTRHGRDAGVPRPEAPSPLQC